MELWAGPAQEEGLKWISNLRGFGSTSVIMFWAGRRERVKACHRKGLGKQIFTMVVSPSPREAK